MKLVFAAQQYALLLLLIAASWGYGRAILRRADAQIVQGPFRHSMPLASGLGVVIVLLQLLAICGWLTLTAVVGVIGAGALLAAFELRRRSPHGGWSAQRAAFRAVPAASQLLFLATLVFAASTLLRPLTPPREWDELMYHLPHAAQWAARGRLTVNEWLRYPWFPYDFDLLYAGALVVGSDVLPHLIHALAGWCAALLLFAWARLLWGRDRAVLAALVWLVLARGQFANAYVDLGVALFVLVGLVAMERWIAERTGAWLLVCAFALGVATGSKYQALSLLPFFLAAICVARPRPRLLAAAIVAFLLPCVYWYARNYLLAGDPVAPLGGHIFGFTDWNEADYRIQMADLRRVAAMPPRVLWPAALAIAVFLLRSSGGPRFAAAFAAWALLTWGATSRYPRYLLPATPVLAALAVCGWQLLAQAGARFLHIARSAIRLQTMGAALLLVAAVIVGVYDLHRSWLEIAATPQQRAALLARDVTGYRIWQYLREHPKERIYQFGLEDSIYYAPAPVFGEIFGPWRYSDYAQLDPQALHDRLEREGFDALVVHTARMAGLVSHPGFDRYFALEQQDGPVMLFTVRKRALP